MNITNLKKMATEKMHKLYTKLTGVMLFNPYSERQYMILMISVKLGIEDENIQSEVVEVKTKTRQSGHFTTIETNQHGFKYFAPVKNAWVQWWEKNGNANAAMPSKGRIPQFSYRQVLHILNLDSIGTEVQAIADLFETSYQNIYNIVIGKTYQWVLER